MRRAVFGLLAAGLAAVGLVGVAAVPAGAAIVPSGFVDELVADNIGNPTAFAFTPDGRILATTQPGLVRVIRNGGLLATPALDISGKVCSNSERGLLGIAVDPQFTTNGFVFLYYSFKRSASCDGSTVNRVSRFVMAGDTLGGEVGLVDNIPSPAGNHNAGDLNFGQDGFLYVSVGDGGCDYAGGGCGGSNNAARDRHALVGKILRITRNGGIPPGNPFGSGEGTAPCAAVGVLSTPGVWCQETFASGLRNPFRMAFDPNAAGTRFYINDVGQSTWEEIDDGAAGADYGWNVREGHCATGSTSNCGAPPAGMTNPIFDYGRADGCTTITGGAFVPSGAWPANYQGKYLFADFGCGRLFRLDPNGSGGFTRVEVASALGTIVHLRFAPWSGTQALFYTTYASGGEIRRIGHLASIPSTTVTGFTWYTAGGSQQSGPAGTVISAYATGLARNATFQLVSSPADPTAPSKVCARDPIPINNALRVSSSSGFIGRTDGAIVNRPPGDYDICFKQVNGTQIGFPLRFTVV
ncbi:MAG: PQQ-dependent sugar dehydrogenase [Acidimicrobiales bacterium]